MAGVYMKSSTRMSLNERFTHLRNSVVTRDPVLESRQSRYDEQQAAMRSRRVQMQMEQRPAVRAALHRARSRSRGRSRSRSRSRSRYGLMGGGRGLGGRPVDIRERLSFRRGRGSGRPLLGRRDSFGSRRDLSGGPPPAAMRRRSRSRSRVRRDSIGSLRGGRGGMGRGGLSNMRARSRSRSRSRRRFAGAVNGRGGVGRGFRRGRGARPRSLSRSRIAPRGSLSRASSTNSLVNKPLGGGVPMRSRSRGGGAPRGRSRVRRDSLTNGVEFRRGGGGSIRGGHFRDSGRGRGRGSLLRSRGRSRSIRDVGKYNAGVRGNTRGGLRGRRGSRGTLRGRGRGGRKIEKPRTSKDDLDRELDQYMATDPLNSDKDLDAYRQDL